MRLRGHKRVPLIGNPVGPLMYLCWDADSTSFLVYLRTGNTVGKAGINAPKNISSKVAAAFAALSVYLFP